MIKKLILILLCLDFVLLSGVYLFPPAKSSGKAVTFQLRRGPFTVYEFPAKGTAPQAVILLGSGDSGWGAWEESTSHALQDHGYTVMGIDSAEYARTDYNLDILQSDFDKIAQTALASAGKPLPPLIVGGWSMGAAQAVAVAGGPHPPEHLVGVLAASLLSRGRYGLRLSDRLNILPTGPGTFAVADFAPNMGHLRIVQWHATLDTIDSSTWLSKLAAPHREYVFPNAGHDYNGACPDFLRQLIESVAWIIHPAPSTATVAKNK